MLRQGIRRMSRIDLHPSREELETIWRQKYGEYAKAGLGPKRRLAFGYFTPDEYYEAIVSKLVVPGCSWIDIGGGRDVFPDNPELAKQLATKSGSLVAVDPSITVNENTIAHRRVQMK